ncbi:MAG: hypothetical protein ACD_20C00402G0025 [uncultured bacterium]|nr:MAG: hypothetical protein ACD_20C00402G0025 [uncultured bacterium]HBH18228.1 hypothetical protein [Cyanobacteria bacterium UBA9579]
MIQSTYQSKLIIKLGSVLIIALVSSGAGYVGQLPQLGGYSGAAQINSEPVLDLTPRKFPAIYTGTVINQGKYSQYLKDLDELIPILESMKQYIDNRDSNIQMFCAKASTITLYINNLKVKYGHKTESHYESFKQIVVLSRKLNETAEYWRYTNKYNKFLRGSLEDKRKDQEIMSQKLSSALDALNVTLEILKENSTD